MPHKIIVTLCLVASALALCGLSPANAEGPAAPENPAGSDATKQKQDNVPLSKKLDENEGVLKPPSNIDPQIHQTPPAATGDKMPVIIPPGEPGGDQSVQPK